MGYQLAEERDVVFELQKQLSRCQGDLELERKESERMRRENFELAETKNVLKKGDQEFVEILESAKNISIQNRQNFDSMFEYSRSVLARSPIRSKGRLMTESVGSPVRKPYLENSQTRSRRSPIRLSPSRRPALPSQVESKKIELFEELEETKALVNRNRSQLDALIAELKKTQEAEKDLLKENEKFKFELQSQLSIIQNYESLAKHDKSSTSQQETQIARLKAEHLSQLEKISSLEKEKNYLAQLSSELEKENLEIREEVKNREKGEFELRLALENERDAGAETKKIFETEQKEKMKTGMEIGVLEKRVRDLEIAKLGVERSLEKTERDLRYTWAIPFSKIFLGDLQAQNFDFFTEIEHKNFLPEIL